VLHKEKENMHVIEKKIETSILEQNVTHAHS